MYVEKYEMSSKKVHFCFPTMRSVFVLFVTTVCVLILVKLRWPKKKTICDMVREYVGYIRETLTAVRVYEKDPSRSRIDLHI